MESLGVMPPNPEQLLLDAEVQHRAMVTDAYGKIAPQVPGGLDPGRVQALYELVPQVLAAMTDGEVQLEMNPPPPGPVPQLPPDLFTPVVALSRLLEQQGAYQFDPLALTSSNEGLAELLNLLTAMLSDTKFQEGLRQPAGTPSSPPPPSVPTSVPDAAPVGDEYEGLV